MVAIPDSHHLECFSIFRRTQRRSGRDPEPAVIIANLGLEKMENIRQPPIHGFADRFLGAPNLRQ
jgi:hypothetical protein